MKRTGLALVVALVALVVAAGSGTAARTHASTRCGGFGHPVLKYPKLYAIGQFKCSTGAKNATETLVLQGFENGKWTKLESASRTVDARPNTTYVVKTPVIQCANSAHNTSVRSTWKLVVPGDFVLKLERKPPDQLRRPVGQLRRAR